MSMAVKERPWIVKLGHSFSDERAFWTLAAFVLGAVSVLRGMRRPSRWAATQSLINYDFGLIKRGLFGATFGKWFHLESYTRFSIVSYILLFLFISLLVCLTLRSGAIRKLGKGETVALFFASCTLTFLAHIVGYMDIPLAIITVGLLLIRDTRLRFIAAVPACIVGILIHEAFLVTFFPCVVFSFIVDILKVPDARGRARLSVALGLLVFVVLSLTLGLALKQRLPQQQITALRGEAIVRADFPIREDVFDLLRHSTGENIVAMKDHFAEPWMDLVYLEDKLIYGATIVLLLAGILRIARIAGTNENRRFLGSAAIITACAPLAMIILGWDFSRWDALCCLECFLVLLILCRTIEEPAPESSPGYRNAVVLTMALSMASSGGMMDDIHPNDFPFIQSMMAVVHDVRRMGWTPKE